LATPYSSRLIGTRFLADTENFVLRDTIMWDWDPSSAGWRTRDDYLLVGSWWSRGESPRTILLCFISL